MKSLWLALLALSAPALAAADNRIDTVRPDAPELADYGQYAVGVRTLTLTHRQQLDLTGDEDNATDPAPIPRTDRRLPVEIWYPAAADASGSHELEVLVRDGKTTATLTGRGIRDAEPLRTDNAFPLVIVSHGYPSNRFLMSPVTEKLASRGYVVAAIDHTDTTYSTLTSFPSALVHRSRDQLFTLDQLMAMAQQPDTFLHHLVKPDSAAIIGYSMGGYGAIISAGGGLTEAAMNTGDDTFSAPPGTLAPYRSGSEALAQQFDPRLKATVAIAPWGYRDGFFDDATLEGVRVPTLYIAGSRDDVVGYDDGVRATWQASTSVDRALLTFINANHNVGVVMPPPEEAYRDDPDAGFNLAMHYLDFVWDNVRMNNVSSHFITAWLDRYLKDDERAMPYLDLVPDAHDGVRRRHEDGTLKAGDTWWTGFPERSAQGLRFERLDAGQ
ncbi:dienelactone hydrolase [Kushneria sp. AK178]